MSRPSTFAKTAIAAMAGLAALTTAASASAQPYGSYNEAGGYDTCRRESNGRGIVGALLGGAIGAAVGANAGARGNRQDGALLGGGLGAIGGAVVGKNSAACGPNSYQQPYSAPRSSYNAPRGSYGGEREYGYNGYAGSAYAAPYAGGGYYAERPRAYVERYEDNGYAYGSRGERFRMANRSAGPDGCSLAESPIHMPDGRVQMRFVRVCMDDSGRYQVVD